MRGYTLQDVYADDARGSRRKIGQLKIDLEVEPDGSLSGGIVTKVVDQSIIFNPNFRHHGLGLNWKHPKDPKVEWEIEQHRGGYYRG